MAYWPLRPSWPTSGPQDDNTLHVVLPRDAIPAISTPEFEPASAARLSDIELVIGVVGEREQRAYSTWQLDRHEIVNDVLETVPSMLTTWKQWKQLYPNSQVLKKRGPSGSAYADYNRDQNRIGIMGRRLRDKRLPNKERIIGVRAGDAATAFAEKDGRAIAGPLEGTRLTRAPAYPAFWFGWLGYFPNTEVWKPTAGGK